MLRRLSTLTAQLELELRAGYKRHSFVVRTSDRRTEPEQAVILERMRAGRRFVIVPRKAATAEEWVQSYAPSMSA